MGLCFDTNGKYVGWSNLFDYSSIDTLQASEYLPMPKHVKYIDNISEQIQVLREKLTNIFNDKTKTTELKDREIETINKEIDKLNNKINIDEDIKKITEEKDIAKQIRLKADLLNKLYKNIYTVDGEKRVNVEYTNLYGSIILKDLRRHEATKIAPSLVEDANKNFISSHIQNTVLALRNMTRAYSPITIGEFRDASENSPKAKELASATLLNPLTKYVMQYANMTGKNVIGIAANAEKASFMWHYYLNELIRSADVDRRKFGHFEFNTSRIIGRSKGQAVETMITGLPDMNFENIKPEVLKEFANRITGNTYVDLMISLVLSASTDNAKELILAKVNAGNKLAKMYLFCITLGMNINDIVSFMTSPVASFIDKITEPNIYSGKPVSLEEAINMARGNFKGKGSYYNSLYLKKFGLLKMKQIEDAYNRAGLNGSDPDIIADCDEFQNVLDGANEFSNFGRLLGFNQGIPTTKVELQSKIAFVQDILQQRINKAKKEIKDKTKDYSEQEIETINNEPPLNVEKWLSNKAYRLHIAEVYDIVKKCINVYDAFTAIPLFDSIRLLLSTVIAIDKNISFKSRAFNLVFERAKEQFGNMSEQYQLNILNGINNILIKNFITTQNILMPVYKGDPYIKAGNTIGKFQESGLLSFNNINSIASFKYLFENSILPKLKQGILTKVDENGNIVLITDVTLTNNTFLNSLLRALEHGVPFYKANLNMLTIKDSTEAQRKFQTYQAGLSQLANYKITSNLTLTDLFMLYNLVVNKNQYGASRMTTLFDSFVSKKKKDSLIYKYFDYLGKIDYNTIPIFDDQNVDKSLYKEGTLFVEINYKDLLIGAAPTVRRVGKQNDPYLIVLNNGIPTVCIKSSYMKYDKDNDLLQKESNEDNNQYIDRILINNNYFTLGGVYSNNLNNMLEVLDKMQDTEKIISYLNNFMKDGLLYINKVCDE